VPPEEPLGFSVEALEPCGTEPEIAASLAAESFPTPVTAPASPSSPPVVVVAAETAGVGETNQGPRPRLKVRRIR
jgi:hypothetical protein